MQAALISCLPMAPNSAEAGEAASAGQAGHGLRINSALQSETIDSLFTTILQKGITINAALNLSAGDLAQIMSADTMKEAEGEEPADICSLLMQMIVMNTSGQTVGGDQSTPNEQALHGVSGSINAIPAAPAGTAPAVPDGTVLPQEDGTAAEVPALQAPVVMETVLAGITDALKGKLPPNNAAGNAVADVDAAVANADAKENTANVNTQVFASAKTAMSPEKDNGVAMAGLIAEVNQPESAEKVKADAARSGEAAAGNVAGGMLSETGMEDAITAEKTNAVERALNKFADDLMSVRGGRQEIRIVLEPESLGVLTITVTKTENGISAKIRSEDREVAAIISDQVQKLISSMQSKGITVSDVDVTYSQTEQNMGFTQQGFSQAREESSKGYTPPQEMNPGEDAPVPEVWQALYGGEADSDTTVEYRV